MRNNVVSLNAVREIKKLKQEHLVKDELVKKGDPVGDPVYEAFILSLNKFELLEEMTHFQEERSAIGELTTAMIIRGQILFKSLEELAETEELRQLARSYRRHLKYELESRQPQTRIDSQGT